jgi:hypothetical protein
VLCNGRTVRTPESDKGDLPVALKLVTPLRWALRARFGISSVILNLA